MEAVNDDKIVHQLVVSESVGNSYKLVRICQGASCFDWQVEVYDSTTREWRKGTKITFDSVMLLPSSSTSFQGLVYCLGLDCSPGGFANTKVVILAYDVAEDQFRIVVSSSVLPCVSQLQLNWFTLQVTVVSNEQQHWIELVGRTDLPISRKKSSPSTVTQTERIFVIRHDAQNHMWVGESDMKVSEGFAQEHCGYLNCSAGGHLLYFTSSTSPFQGVVMYDRSKARAWSTLPHHIQQDEDVLHRLFGGSMSMSSFIPRLDLEYLCNSQ